MRPLDRLRENVAVERSRRDAPARRVSLGGSLASVIVVVASVVAATLAFSDRQLDADVPVPEPVDWFVPVQISGALIWLVAAWSLSQRRDLIWSRLAVVVSLSHAFAALFVAWAIHGLVGGHPAPGATLAAGSAMWLLPIEMPIGIYMMVSLPSGRLGRTGIDRIGLCAVAMATCGVVISMGSLPDVSGTEFAAARNPLSLGLSSGPWPGLLIGPAAIVAVGVLVVKWRRSVGSDRQALWWIVAVNVVGTLLVIPVIALAPDGVGVGVAQVTAAISVLALVTVVRRHHLLGIERFFERTLRVAIIVAALTVVYAAVIAGGSSLFGGGARVIAAAVVALAVVPVRDRVERGVERFVYGDRLAGDELARRLAARATTAIGPVELLDSVVVDLVDATGLRGLRVELDGLGVVTAHGELGSGAVGVAEIALRNGGTVIGQLACWPPVGEVCLDAPSRKLLDDAAPYIAIVAESCRTQTALQRSREQLLEASERERRRLRHDLHDGLGPILTGVAFSIDAASNLLPSNPARAESLLFETRADVANALDEIRRIVDDLRPPAIDDLGLVGAIRQHAARLASLDVSVTAATPIIHLPAAVEVAAYRIVTEALTNVVRHAGARSAHVEMSVNGDFSLSVTDDGSGATPWIPGVGLGSMRARVDELGGTMNAAAGPHGGLVTARLPLPNS